MKSIIRGESASRSCQILKRSSLGSLLKGWKVFADDICVEVEGGVAILLGLFEKNSVEEQLSAVKEDAELMFKVISLVVWIWEDKLVFRGLGRIGKNVV